MPQKDIKKILCASAFVLGLVHPASAGPASTMPASWNYNTGSEHWARLGPDFAACAVGIEQSPIDIDTGQTVVKPLPALQTGYSIIRAPLQRTSLALTLTPPKGQRLMLGKESYELEEIRFHSPSEHTVDFKETGAEVQLVHRDNTGKILILAVLLRIEEYEKTIPPSGLEKLWPRLGANMPSSAASAEVNLKQLVPANQPYYSYTGSLTTPPCTEGVRWLVMKKPVLIRPKEFSPLAGAIGRNARDIQKRGNRRVEESAK